MAHLCFVLICCRITYLSDSLLQLDHVDGLRCPLHEGVDDVLDDGHSGEEHDDGKKEGADRISNVPSGVVLQVWTGVDRYERGRCISDHQGYTRCEQEV